MLNTGFGGLAHDRVDRYPEPLRDEIDVLNERIYDSVNDAVYKVGFTTKQDVYEREVRGIFVLLDELDERLATRRYLFGDEPVETDWRLYTTLARFDAVYAIHFKCSLRRIVDYANLWPYLRDLYQRPGIAETTRFDEIRAHYYRTHPEINPTGLEQRVLGGNTVDGIVAAREDRRDLLRRQPVGEELEHRRRRLDKVGPLVGSYAVLMSDSMVAVVKEEDTSWGLTL